MSKKDIFKVFESIVGDGSTIDPLDTYIIAKNKYKDTNDERIISALDELREIIIDDYKC